MRTAKSVLTVSSTETQVILMNWLQATEEFHAHYCQINHTISNQQRNLRQRDLIGVTKEKIRGLLKLRQYMIDVLKTLLGNIDRPHPAPLKPGQLISHTRLLQEINLKVKSEMNRLAGAQA